MNNVYVKCIALSIIVAIVSCSKEEDFSVAFKTNTPSTFQNQSEIANEGLYEFGPSLLNPWNGEVMQIGNDVVVQWMDLYLELERYATGMRPNASARAIAYVNLAAYETAVPFMPLFVSNQTKLEGLELPGFTSKYVDVQLALNACYSRLLDHFLLQMSESQKLQMHDLEDVLQETYSKGLTDRWLQDSKDWGVSVAEAIITYSQTDGEAENQILEPQPLSYEPPVGTGYWTYSAEPERALFPYWERTRTFVISPEETYSVAPLPYSKNPVHPFYSQMLEVHTANNTAKRLDGEQLWIAEFWSDDVDGLMISPPCRQVSIANQLVKQQQFSLSRTLLMYLKLGFALNDAAVAAWKYKYEYMVMRPSVFIQENIDSNFQTNLFRLVAWPNPSFPSYPSGHSTFASAAGGVFIAFFGNEINFTDRTHEGRTAFRGMPRTFETVRQMAWENAYSRIPLGVHLRMDCDEGYRLGYEIADAINEYNLAESSHLNDVVGK